MSSSLSITTNYIEQIESTDPLEAGAWAELEITIGELNVTSVIDRTDSQVRSGIDVPIFPIAQWIVENWWNILNEPCRTESIPSFNTIDKNLPWVKRHSLRAADSSLVLPRLYFYNDGYAITAVSDPDYNDPLPNMPAQFLTRGAEQLTVQETTEAFSKLVGELLERLDGVLDERLEELKAQWEAIRSADSEERAFCKAVGRMGINPYDPDEIPTELAAAVCSMSGDPDIPVNRDLTESTTAALFPEQLSWVQNTRREMHLRKIPDAVLSKFTVQRRGGQTRPHEYGYEVARYLRGKVSLAGDSCIDDVAAAAMDALDRPISRQFHNHLTGFNIRGIVGWSDDGGAIVAGPDSGSGDKDRFLLARGLYHALCSCEDSERLVTQAYTWDQSASRSFAAEFLAPQAALVAKTGYRADWEKVDELARAFDVEPRVIELQLKNASVEVMI